ncbi:MAG TPA: LacI family DNA-binding transcriptional regulator [Mycobacteriales bacterium]
MRTRLKDVAERAGVSVKTVSNVVNGYEHVTAKTRSQVEAALVDLGYVPNLAARGLRNGRSGVIALALPELHAPYFAEIAHHVVRAAADRGWTVLVDETEGRLDRERQVAAGIRAHLIDGLILSPLALTAADLDGRADGVPLVLLGERVRHDVADRVAVDNVQAARDATAHLLRQGRRRIAAIGVQRSAAGASARLRLQGYRKAVREHGLDLDPVLAVPAAAWHRADGAAAVRSLLELGPPPDALFCFNDLLALGALRALHEAGLRVPDDVAVVGFDDIEETRYSTPSLSTVSPAKDGIAGTAVDLLVARLAAQAGAPSPPRRVVAAHTLAVRESSG